MKKTLIALISALLFIAGTAAPAAAWTNYGSGQGADWSGYSNLISSPEIIRSVKYRDGLYVFGDSITVGTAGDLATRLIAETGDTLAVNAWSARPTAPAVDVLQAWKDTYGLTHRVVMATGTNDIFDPTVMAAQVDRVMAIVGPDVQVWWVDVQIARTSQSAAVQLADQRNAGWINGVLYEKSGRYPNLHVVSWSRFLAYKPTRLTAYLRDGVHTTADGTGARNALILQSIVRDAPSLTYNARTAN